MNERRAVAIHEAGHALVAHILGATIHEVSIVPKGDVLGYVSYDVPPWTRATVRTKLGRTFVYTRPEWHRLTIAAAGQQADILFGSSRQVAAEGARFDCELEWTVVNDLGVSYFGLNPENAMEVASLRAKRTGELHQADHRAAGYLSPLLGTVDGLAKELWANPWTRGDRVHDFLRDSGVEPVETVQRSTSA